MSGPESIRLAACDYGHGDFHIRPPADEDVYGPEQPYRMDLDRHVFMVPAELWRTFQQAEAAYEAATAAVFAAIEPEHQRRLRLFWDPVTNGRFVEVAECHYEPDGSYVVDRVREEGG